MTPPRHRNIQSYVLYQLGGLTATITDRACDACGRRNLGLEYRSTRREGAEVVICNICMSHISEDHAEYINLRKGKPQ